jgi:predicted DNA-binding antitoxin AbrB/MazE fold protein
MNQIDAIYRHGVFEPLQPVDLKEEQRVRLKIELAEKETIADWFKRVDARREEIFQREGYLPDSTLDIAEDRRR